MYSCKTHRQESARGVLKLVFLYSLTFLVQGSAQQSEHQKDGGDGFMIVHEPVTPYQSLEHVSDTQSSNHQYTKPIQPSNSSLLILLCQLVGEHLHPETTFFLFMFPHFFFHASAFLFFINVRHLSKC